MLVTPELPPSFLEEGIGFDPVPHESAFARGIDTEPLRNLVHEAMKRFPDDPGRSDAWLAPRVHYALRLSRREAARRSVWTWLGIALLPSYVRWRFPAGGSTPIERFTGREDKHALGRLWWGAELMRNGRNYEPVCAGFSMQDIPNTWMRLHAFHHRPLVQAVLQELAVFNDGKPATSDQVNALAKAMNTTAYTVLLDAIAPDPEFEGGDLEAWLDEEVDETLVLDQEPNGLLEDGVPEPELNAMRELVREVAARTPAMTKSRTDPKAAA